MLLLTVVTLAAAGRLAANRVPFDTALHEAFAAVWRALVPGPVGRLHYPFWHLERTLWTPIAVPEHAAVLAGRRAGDTPPAAWLSHAVLADDLFDALQTADGRDEVRGLVLGVYFPEATSERRLRLAQVEGFEQAAFRYALDVQRPAALAEPMLPPAPVRSAAFRRAVLDAYGQTCAVSGLRLTTPDGGNLVEAAHVHEWACSQDDRPQNGLALLPTLHWMFDRGLFTVAAGLTVRVSPRARDCAGDVDALLLRHDGARLRLPSEAAQHPDPEALAWHRRERFLA